MVSLISAFFVKARASTIFALMFGIPFCVVLLLTLTWDNRDPVKVIDTLLYLTVYMNLIILCWVYSVGRYLFSTSRVIWKVGFHWFRIGVLYLSLMLFVMFFYSQFQNLIYSKTFSAVLFIMFSVAVLFVYYIMAYLSKAIVDIERRRSSGYIVTFIELLLFPLGIWAVQTRINNIYKSDVEHT
jgi:hypothetical protein